MRETGAGEEEKSKLDLMVSFSAEDEPFVCGLVEALDKQGLTVWRMGKAMSPYSDSKQGPAQAVIDCKVFLQVLSKCSAEDTNCQDELALAYISNTPTFPIGRQYFPKIVPFMTSSMKLILAKINWTFFVKDDTFDENFEQLIGAMKPTLDSCSIGVVQSSLPEDTKQSDVTPAKGFWDRHFPSKNEVTWIDFRKFFLEDYGSKLKQNFEDENITKWTVNLIYKDIFELKKSITRDTVKNFIGDNSRPDQDQFYNRVIDYSIGTFAMKEVFNMESSVRLTAVQNLGSFHTPAVIQVLLGFLGDTDPNLRAVAALALGRTGTKNRRVLDKLQHLLTDEDRLVRQSTCLSIGKLKASHLLANLLETWRNDPIHEVRESALIALDLMGGEEGKKVVKITQVLSAEMASLRKPKS